MLTEANQKRILETFAARQPVDHFAALVPNADLAANDYNLSVSSHVEGEDTREAVDIAD